MKTKEQILLEKAYELVIESSSRNYAKDGIVFLTTEKRDSDNNLIFVKKDQLNNEQLQKLEQLLTDAENHEEYSGGRPDGSSYVKGIKEDQGRVIALIGNNVVGFMSPQFHPERGYWRSGAIYVSPEYQRKGIASAMLQKFFDDPNHLPAKAWIANDNIASQRAFKHAGFIQHQERNLSDSIRDQGYDWVKK